MILEYIFIIKGEKANSVLANTIIRCKIVFCLVWEDGEMPRSGIGGLFEKLM